MKRDHGGDPVRVAIRLSARSVTDAGYRLNRLARDPEAQAYRKSLEAEQKEIISLIEAAIGHPLEVVWHFTMSANVISANVPAADMERIRAVDGVVSVTEEKLSRPMSPKQRQRGGRKGGMASAEVIPGKVENNVCKHLILNLTEEEQV